MPTAIETIGQALLTATTRMKAMWGEVRGCVVVVAVLLRLHVPLTQHAAELCGGLPGFWTRT
jgi:hypothetical protein